MVSVQKVLENNLGENLSDVKSENEKKESFGRIKEKIKNGFMTNREQGLSLQRESHLGRRHRGRQVLPRPSPRHQRRGRHHQGDPRRRPGRHRMQHRLRLWHEQGQVELFDRGRRMSASALTTQIKEKDMKQDKDFRSILKSSDHSSKGKRKEKVGLRVDFKVQVKRKDQGGKSKGVENKKGNCWFHRETDKEYVDHSYADCMYLMIPPSHKPDLFQISQEESNMDDDLPFTLPPLPNPLNSEPPTCYRMRQAYDPNGNGKWTTVDEDFSPIAEATVVLDWMHGVNSLVELVYRAYAVEMKTESFKDTREESYENMTNLLSQANQDTNGVTTMVSKLAIQPGRRNSPGCDEKSDRRARSKRVVPFWLYLAQSLHYERD